MTVALTHLHEHKGVFASTMGGGSIWYAPDATAAEIEFRMIYRIGPGASAPVFFVTPDDRFLVQPIQGVVSEGDTPPIGPSVYNRDYDDEHSRRVIVLDIQKLLRAGTLVKCDAPPVVTDASGTITKITARNNGAADCPRVAGTLNLGSQANFETHSGPHFGRIRSRDAPGRDLELFCAADAVHIAGPSRGWGPSGVHGQTDPDRSAGPRPGVQGRTEPDRAGVHRDGPAGVLSLAQSRSHRCCQAACDGLRQL